MGNIMQMAHDSGALPTSWTRRYRYEDISLGDARTSNRLLGTNAAEDLVGQFSAMYTYDEHGSMTSMPHLPLMGWDNNDQMRQVHLGGGGTAYYTYDAAGQRVRKVWEHSGLVEERIYLGGWELYRKRDSLGTLLVERETLHGMDGTKRVVLVETKTVDVAAGGAFSVVSRYRFQLDNHLGSASLEVDESGLVIGYEEYHPYGTTAYTSGRGGDGVEVSGKRYRYTGKERDEETGLYYHGARHMAPWLGRWTSADPAGTVDGTNLYAYVRGSPVGLMDPSGTEAKTTFLGWSTASADLARRQKFWGGNQYWSNDGPQGAGWYVKTDGKRILSGRGLRNQTPRELPSGPGMEFLHWTPTNAVQPEEVPKAEDLKNEAAVSAPSDAGGSVAALPAFKLLESAAEDLAQSGIRRIAPVPGTVASGAIAGAAVVGAAVGGVVFFWDTNTSVKPWMDELNPNTGVVYKSEEEYQEVKRNPPIVGGARDHRKQVPKSGPLEDPWAETGPGATPNTGDPCDRAPVDRCDSLGDNFKYDSRDGALKEAENQLGKGPYRTSTSGSNRKMDDVGFPTDATHETYLTPDNDKFSIGSAPCCENLGGIPVFRTRWAFYK